MPDTAVMCWGDNDFGQLGVGTTDGVDGPTPLGFTRVRKIALGNFHSCALDADGFVFCWGANYSGQVGDRSNEQRATRELAMVDAVDVAAGTNHSCAVSDDGRVFCWGFNLFGQLGDGTTEDRNRPTLVPGISDAEKVVAGDSHTCALLRGGVVRCWGSNRRGALGDGSGEDSRTPVTVAIDGVDDIVSGAEHVCALRDSELLCWGSNVSGQLALDPEESGSAVTPVRVMAGEVSAFGAGLGTTCVISGPLGRPLCWGGNDFGQVGDGTFEDRAEPRVVLPPLP